MVLVLYLLARTATAAISATIAYATPASRIATPIARRRRCEPATNRSDQSAEGSVSHSFGTTRNTSNQAAPYAERNIWIKSHSVRAIDVFA